MEESRIYKRPDEELKPFERSVNAAARDLCLKDVSLLNRRSTLLESARKKVAEEGYTFKKGHSQSKVYGQSETSRPKRTKYDEKMREEHIQSIDEELADISRILDFKGKTLSQHEVAKNYRLCEQVTEEMMSMKRRKRELETERNEFVKKSRRAKARLRKKDVIRASDTSDDLPSSRSSTRSRSVTPQLNSSSLHSSLGSPVLLSDVQLPMHSKSLAPPKPELCSSKVSSRDSLSPSVSCLQSSPVDSVSDSEDESNQSHF